MSFSGQVKEELLNRISNASHCNIAEISAILSFCGNVLIDENNQYSIVVRTETEATAKKIEKLIWKTFYIETIFSTMQNTYSKNQITYTISIKNHDESVKILKATKLMDEDGEIRENLSITDNVILKRDCCKRAFLRGAFMAAGSMTDPKKSYHFEIVCNGEKKANQIINFMNYFQIDAKTVARKGKFVVYIKEGEGIIDILNVMDASVSLMEMENIRILKGMANYYNRQVNCEAANIIKTVTTAQRQIEDINFILRLKGIHYLPDKLRDIAMIRIENPDMPLQELGQMMDPPLGKSGVNHRLRKISQVAEDLRNA